MIALSLKFMVHISVAMGENVTLFSIIKDKIDFQSFIPIFLLKQTI